MKTIMTILLIALSSLSVAQTHVTPNEEKCWIIKKVTDALDSTFTVVVIEGEEPSDNAKIEKILKSGKKVEDRLIAEGYRVEIFKNKDIRKIKTSDKN